MLSIWWCPLRISSLVTVSADQVMASLRGSSVNGVP